MNGHSMKRGLGAISMTIAVLAVVPAVAQTATPPTLDERLGCGMMFVSFDETVKAVPALGASLGGANREGGLAMMKMLGANGALT